MCLLAWATMTGPTKYLWLENLLYLSCVCLIGMIIVFVLVVSLFLTWTHCCHSWSWEEHRLGKGRCQWRRESFQTERWNFLLTGLLACPRRPPPHCECSIAFSRTRCTTASQQRPPLQTVSRPPSNTNKTIKCHLHQTLGFLVEKYPSSCKLRSWKTADSTRTVFSLSDMLLRCPTWFTTGWQQSKIYVFISLSPGWKLSESTQAPRRHHLESQATQIPLRLLLYNIGFLLKIKNFKNICFDFLHLLQIYRKNN